MQWSTVVKNPALYIGEVVQDTWEVYPFRLMGTSNVHPQIGAKRELIIFQIFCKNSTRFQGFANCPEARPVGKGF